MRRFLIVISFVCASAVLGAAGGAGGASRNWWSVEAGGASVADTYLSNQEYSGVVFGFNARHAGWYAGTERVGWEVYDHWRYAPQLVNASRSAAYRYASLTVGYGTHYIWQPGCGFRLKAGGAAEVHGALKMQSRNVNNVASGDISAVVLATAGAEWRRAYRGWQFVLAYDVAVPVAGAMFVPQMGQSYYELYLTLPRGLGEVVHFASLHNMQGVRGDFRADFRYRTFTFFVGFTHDYRQWRANGIECYDSFLTGRLGFALTIDVLSGDDL